MKVAVTHENGKVFQHFGHAEEFQVFELDDNGIVSSEIIETNGSGHAEVAAYLDAAGVDVVICGGLGEGALDALREADIEVISGVEGDINDVMESFMAGELFSAGVNCNNDDEGCGCGCGDSEGGCGSCGGGCGGCGGGCHTPSFDGPNVGKKVKAHYCGTFNDGTQFDSSYDRGEPLEFVCGAGMMILGFDKAVANMKVGEIVNVHLMPEEAYGPLDPDAFITVAIAELPGSEELEVGQHVYLQNMYGQPIPVSVSGKTETEITFNANHEMAGKELNFKIELVEVEE